MSEGLAATPQPGALRGLRRAESWALEVTERDGVPLSDGRVLVPLRQSELLRRMGLDATNGLVSRYLSQLGSIVERRGGGGLIFDVARLQSAAAARPRLQTVPRGSEPPGGRWRSGSGGGTPPGAGDPDLVEELEAARDLIAAQARYIAVLSARSGVATPSLATGPAAASLPLAGDPFAAARELTDGRAIPRDSRAALEELKEARASFYTNMHEEAQLASSLSVDPRAEGRAAEVAFRATPRPQEGSGDIPHAPSGGASLPRADWSDDEIEALVSPLSEACKARRLQGLINPTGLLAALHAAELNRAEIHRGAQAIAARVRSGEQISSPFGLLTKAAQEGWRQYFEPSTAHLERTAARRPGPSREDGIELGDALGGVEEAVAIPSGAQEADTACGGSVPVLEDRAEQLERLRALRRQLPDSGGSVALTDDSSPCLGDREGGNVEGP